MFRLSSVPLLTLLLCSSVATAGRDPLPRPASLEHQVRFWTRVYTEVDRDGGFIHDSRNLDVIYESIRVPRDLSRRTREHRIDRVKKKYIQILRKLGKGNRTGLSAEESRVLALFPDGVSNRRLQKAAKLVRFQLGQADRFRDGLKRSTRWRDHIDRALRRHGVPPELAALPHVESSFNPAAYSRVGAAGLWQFTRSTGRLFLRVDNVVDERMDPLLASDGAARLLRANYDDLGSWPLAITAYNHGAGGMARAVRKLGTDDLGVIVEKYDGRTFGFASRNFYTEFLAALHVDRNADRYFGPIDHDVPVDYERVTVDDFYPAVAIEAAFGVDRELLREHNRSLRPAVWNGAKYVPRGFELKVPADAVRTPLATALAKIPAPQRFAKQHRDRLYKVRRGDTLSRIARRYHVKERDLMALNNIRSRNRIRAGQVLTLPDAPGARAPVSIARAEAPKDGHYRVRRGDTLSTIAARFGVSETKLVSLNGLRNRNRLAVGQRLQLRSDPAPSEIARPAPAPPAPVATPEPVVVAAAPEIPEAPEAPPAPEVAAPAPSVPKPAPVPVAAVPVAAEPVVVEPVVVEPVAVEPAAESPAPVVVASARSVRVIEPTPEPEAEPTVGSSPVIPKADPSDYAVTASGRITVQAAETLGHYADWLEIPTSRLRRLNKMSYRTPVAIGRQTKLDFAKVTPEQFEQRRLEYHHTLQEEYFDAYEVTGTDTHVLRAGDTLWELAEVRYQVPVWLLRQYNPVLDFGALQAGTRLVIPQISPRTS